MNSQYHIDTQNRSDYSLPAGLHCQSALTGRIPKAHEKVFLFCGHPCVPLCGGTGGDTLGCADLLGISLSTFSRFATII